MMISFQTGTNKFQCRAASILFHKNRILFQRQSQDDLWFIPGGRVEFDESADYTIDREMQEEFGVTVLDKKMIWIVENFVSFPDMQVHEIGFFFLVTLSEDEPIYSNDTEFKGLEDGFVNKWIHLDHLENYKIVPEFVVPELKCLDMNNGIKHVINRSVRS